MRAKSIYGVISLGVAGGCITGIIFAIKEILANRYLSYSMYKLCADVLQQSLNKWAGAGLAVSFIFIIMRLLYDRCVPFIRKGKPLEHHFPKTFTKGLSFRYTTAWVIPFLIVLAGAQILPGILTPNAYRPPVILISIDALRADHVGCYGYQRDTTPFIDSFAKEGILFKSCYIPEPWTLTSHANHKDGAPLCQRC